MTGSSLFKHAEAFGVTEPKGVAGYEALDEAVKKFVSDPSTIRIAGTYRGDPVILNYQPESRVVVVQLPNGVFQSGWTMSRDQLWNVAQKASLQ